MKLKDGDKIFDNETGMIGIVISSGKKYVREDNKKSEDIYEDLLNDGVIRLITDREFNNFKNGGSIIYKN